MSWNMQLSFIQPQLSEFCHFMLVELVCSKIKKVKLLCWYWSSSEPHTPLQTYFIARTCIKSHFCFSLLFLLLLLKFVLYLHTMVCRTLLYYCEHFRIMIKKKSVFCTYVNIKLWKHGGSTEVKVLYIFYHGSR